MTDRELDDRVLEWLLARDPGGVPETLRAAAARVPYEVRRPVLARFVDVLPWWPGVVQARRPVAVLVVVVALLAVIAVAALIVGVLRRSPLLDRPANGLIAFVGTLAAPDGTAGDIYIVNPDGTGLRQLTRTTANEFDPIFSSDGRRLAFVRGDAPIPGAAQLVVIDPATGHEQLVAPIPRQASWISLGWAPDGRSLLVTGGGAWTFEFETSAWTQLPQDAAVAAWSPIGQLLVNADSDLFLVQPGDALRFDPDHTENTGVRRLTNDSEYEGFPEVAPDGSAILFTRGPGDRVEVLDLDSGERRVVAANAFSGAWSPNGRSIAYLGSGDARGGEAWVVEVDGSNRRMVGRSFVHPKWSPDGSLLSLLDAQGLYLVREDGSGEPVRLTPHEPWPAETGGGWPPGDTGQEYFWLTTDWQPLP